MFLMVNDCGAYDSVIVFVCVCLPSCTYQKRLSDPYELSLQVVVSHSRLILGTKFGRIRSKGNALNC